MSYNLPPGVTQADVDRAYEGEWRTPIEGDYCEQNCGDRLVAVDEELFCPTCDGLPIQRHDEAR